ncbi:hypothetical protein [Marinifilum flexuosum]|uniref:Uncharacterized protein n=1 Tax=Marinifilum flexuosum TaxID=1117708 RepID=A0A419WGR0_9BACT|nr:hypothetical protein [Marinifilum flexuosum]RKD94595.1 hypothetical protein BXY64_4183 [Marinifilum flexuosum]
MSSVYAIWSAESVVRDSYGTSGQPEMPYGCRTFRFVKKILVRVQVCYIFSKKSIKYMSFKPIAED